MMAVSRSSPDKERKKPRVSGESPGIGCATKVSSSQRNATTTGEFHRSPERLRQGRQAQNLLHSAGDGRVQAERSLARATIRHPLDFARRTVALQVLQELGTASPARRGGPGGVRPVPRPRGSCAAERSAKAPPSHAHSLEPRADDRPLRQDHRALHVSSSASLFDDQQQVQRLPVEGHVLPCPRLSIFRNVDQGRDVLRVVVAAQVWGPRRGGRGSSGTVPRPPSSRRSAFVAATIRTSTGTVWSAELFNVRAPGAPEQLRLRRGGRPTVEKIACRWPRSSPPPRCRRPVKEPLWSNSSDSSSVLVGRRS